MAYNKPLPVPNVESKPFWEGCKAHELLLQTCDKCGHTQLYPRSLCRQCHGDSLSWKQSSGKGTVYSFTTVRRAPSQAFIADVPYIIAIVEVEGGVRMMTNLVGCTPEQVEMDMPVRVVFEDVSDDITLPKFEPVP